MRILGQAILIFFTIYILFRTLEGAGVFVTKSELTAFFWSIILTIGFVLAFLI